MTSNLGSHALLAEDKTPEEKEATVLDTVRSVFKPEFLNRLDDIVVFTALTQPELARIVDLHLATLQQRLQDRQIDLNCSPEATQWLAAEGFDPAYGARPLRRLIQRKIGDQLAKKMLAGDIKENSKVSVDLTNNDLILTVIG